MSSATTRPPHATTISTAARPRPEAPPVTRTVRPLSCICRFYLSPTSYLLPPNFVPTPGVPACAAEHTAGLKPRPTALTRAGPLHMALRLLRGGGYTPGF